MLVDSMLDNTDKAEIKSLEVVCPSGIGGMANDKRTAVKQQHQGRNTIGNRCVHQSPEVFQGRAFRRELDSTGNAQPIRHARSAQIGPRFLSKECPDGLATLIARLSKPRCHWQLH